MALSAAQSKEGDKENLRLNIPEAAIKHGWMDREIGSRREGRKDKKQNKSFKGSLGILDLLSPVIWAPCYWHLLMTDPGLKGAARFPLLPDGYDKPALLFLILIKGNQA